MKSSESVRITRDSHFLLDAIICDLRQFYTIICHQESQMLLEIPGRQRDFCHRVIQQQIEMVKVPVILRQTSNSNC